MRKCVILGLISAILTISGCGIGRKVSGSSEVTREGVKVIQHSEMVPVLVKMDIPEISERVSVRDSSSHLENGYAWSDASVDRFGTLSHSLGTIPHEVEKEVLVRVEYQDSIVFRDRVVETVVEKKVEKELNAWQKFRLRGFWILLAAAAFAYRKEIAGLVKGIASQFLV